MSTRKKVYFDSYRPLFERLFARGISTPWERYEDGLPQNRLALNGFFCHSDCTDGPCHIDPFGRGVSQTVCGRTSLEMALAWLCSIVSRGLTRRLLETRDDAGTSPSIPRELAQLISMPAQYRLDPARVLRALKAAALSAANAEADAAHGEPCRPGRIGCGLGARNPLRPAVLLDGLCTATAQQIARSLESSGLDCLVTGNERVGFCSRLPVLCPSSLVGVVIASGAVDAVISGDRSRGRFSPQANVPGAAAIFDEKGHLCDVVAAARRHFSEYPPVPMASRTAMWGRLDVPAAGYLILAGGLSVKKTCGADIVALTQIAVDDGYGVFAFGDTAAALGEAGLIGSKGGSCVVPADNPSGLGWAFALIRDRSFGMPVIAAFPEATSAADIASALMMSVLGVPTYFGSVLPLWGPSVPDALGLGATDGLPLVTYPENTSVAAAWTRLTEIVTARGGAS